MRPVRAAIFVVLQGVFLSKALIAAQVWLGMVSTQPHNLPALIDSNTPTFWSDGRLFLYGSTGHSILHELDNNLNIISTTEVQVDRDNHFPMWIESVWRDDTGMIYAWYHHEQVDVCPSLTVPEIGALVSHDGGRSFTDLGIIINSGDPANCSAQNGYFAGGHGDFSVVPDRERRFFYFLFGSYGGSVFGQGIAIARMPFEAITNPVGAVQKYYRGAWTEPGLGGRVTSILPAGVGWENWNTDSFWGPSVHWNTHINRYVIVMNRSCCEPGWPQEGVYLTMNEDLSNPQGWSPPLKLVEGGGWYPWIQGLGADETSSEAGQYVRLFLRQESEFELIFYNETDIDTGNESDVRRDSSVRLLKSCSAQGSRTEVSCQPSVLIKRSKRVTQGGSGARR